MSLEFVMTTIAWDGEYMAADSMVTVGGRINALDAHKLKRGRDFVMGASGDSAQIARWWRDVSSMTLAEVVARGYPDYEEGKNEPRIMIAAPDDRLFTHSAGMFLEFQGTISGRRVWAIGSGDEIAIGALLAGATAEAAVHLASEVDPYTGGIITRMRVTA
jgi:ATP-dependent protease HslVU (ClpYQ) peptidase subunit